MWFYEHRSAVQVFAKFRSSDREASWRQYEGQVQWQWSAVLGLQA